MKTLLVIVGPTGVGKTELSLRVAEAFGCPILNADSRQIYRDLPIGTAAPTPEEQARVKHYFVGTKALNEDYNAGQYERDVLQLIAGGELNSDVAVLSGGSMMYIDAVCYGLDDIPTVPAEIREQVRRSYDSKGLAWLQQQVQTCDPAYWEVVDQANPQRLMHALEVTMTAQCPYSSLRSHTAKKRDFAIVKVGLDRPRAELYERIDRRVDVMMEQGLLREAQQAFAQCQGQVPNSLQTVGYKELFAYFNGENTLEEAVNLIKQNSRHYAKRQMTWFHRDNSIRWLDARLDYETQLHTITAWLADTGRVQ